MEVLTNTSVDFMGLRRVFVPLSAALMVASAALFFFGNLNLGIDFAGGTQLIVKFSEPPEIDQLRDRLAGEGFEEPPILQRFGQASDNEVLIKTRLSDELAEGSRGVVTDSLDRYYNSGERGFDLNQEGSASISEFLLQRDPDDVRTLGGEAAAAHYQISGESIMALRQEDGLLDSWEELQAIQGLSSEVFATLRSEARLGAFAILSAENVGPQIGSELRTKGILAVVFSLVGMLAYIWLRFELRFGLGALVALLHDVVISLGLFTVLGYEFNLITIAAFLALVGYSVNDSVVIFDRVRENLRLHRRQSLVDVINQSLNQTLSRTVLTSGTTLLMLATMFIFGGDALRGFSFVLLIGVAIGTYSSIFIASPVVLLWERFRSSSR